MDFSGSCRSSTHGQVQIVSARPASHELPDTTRTDTRNSVGVKSRLGLRQVDQILGNAFFLENTFDHLAIAAASFKSMLQGAAATAGEVIDVAGDLIGHHQRQIGVGGFDLRGSLGFQIRIDRVIRDFVGFVDRRRLSFLLGSVVGGGVVLLFQGLQFQLVHTCKHAVELRLIAVVGANLRGAAHQQVEGAVKMLLGGFFVPSGIFVLAQLVFILDFAHQFGDRISLGLNRFCSLNHRAGGADF